MTRINEFKSDKVNEFSSPKENYSWMQIELLVKKVANKILSSNKRYDVILGITNGGIVPARLIARELEINHLLIIPVRSKELHEEEMLPLFNNKKYLVIDDIYDTGHTYSIVFNKVVKFDCDFAFLVKRYEDKERNGRRIYVGEILNHKKWIIFPWERKMDSVLE